MSRFILICLLGFTLGCEGTGERPERPRRGRRHKPDTPIVEPDKPVVKPGKFTASQKTQLASRATVFRDIAGHIRDGKIKDMYDINKAITESQVAAGTKFNASLSELFGDEIQDDNGLKSDAADKFDSYAAELETLIK